MKTEAQIWATIEQHFAKLTDLTEEEQKNYLSYLHDTDPEVHKLLYELIQEDENLHPLFSHSAVDILESWHDQRLIGSHIGIYRIERLLGQGAMASVFLAKRDDGEFDQAVAMKLIKPGIYGSHSLRLFKKERQTLATLQHPHIARLYDGGVNQEGRPFFTMEYIKGLPISDYCKVNQLGLEERLHLFKQVGHAVNYAHGRLIAHLDLKPGNILVDTDGQVKVLDFGISRMMPSFEIDNLPDKNLKKENSVHFTLAYASPEQIQNAVVDTSSDIYSLGIILYEIIVGSHPFSEYFNDPELLKKAISDGRFPGIGEFKGSLPSGLRINGSLFELEKIWLCSMNGERAKRYGSVESLLRDIDSFLNLEPLAVVENTGIYRTKKFFQRHRKLVSVVSLALTILMMTVVFYTRQVKQQRDLAIKEATKASRITDLLSGIFQMADPNLANGDTITAIQLLTKGLNDLEATLKDEPEIRASLLHEFTSIFIGLGRYQLADSLAREAYTLTDSIYSSPHPEVARSLLGLGQVEIMYKNLDTAFNHLHASYKMYKDIKSNDPSAIANVLLELGNVNYEKGDYLAADSLNRKVFEIHQTHYQSPHEELAHDLQMIGTTQRKLGNFNEAVSYLQQALAMKRELFEEPHNEIAYTLNHLASLKVDLGLYEEAVPYARESFDQRSRIYGPIHIETIASQSNLARIHKALGHYETAIPIYEDALKKLKKIFPSGHPYIGATLQSLADLYLLSENISLAEEYFREALLIDQKFLDKDDIHRSYCMIGLGKLLTRINRLEEAKYLLESAYELRTTNLPEGHVLIGINQQALGECLLAMKDYETTIYYLNEAYESLIKMPDKYQDNLQIILEKLIFACEQSGFTERQSKYRLFLNNLTS